MLKYLLQRLALAVATLWFIATLVFCSARLTGDPTHWLLPEDAPPQARQELRESLGLDRPLLAQYGTYLTGLIRGRVATSYYEPRPVREILMERLPHTLRLAGLALVGTWSFGLLLGGLAAVNHNGVLDRTVVAVASLVSAVPSFVVAIGMILMFSVVLRVLPTSGTGTWRNLVMPVATLTVLGAAGLVRLVRGSLLETLDQDFVRTARAKGLRRWGTVGKHAMRNAAIPLLTVFGTQLGTLVAGTVVVETVFAWPGLGRAIVAAVNTRDFPLLQTSILLVSGTVIACNLLVDLLYPMVDPRVRLGG